MTTYYFQPPTVDANPRFTDGSTALQRGLFKFYKPLPRGINVFLLADGSFVQDTPTAENENSSVPYPIFNAQNLVSRSWNPFTLTEVDTPVRNPVVKVYYGGHVTQISVQEAAALTSAGYSSNITTGP